MKALQNKVASYEVEVSELKDILEKKEEEIANLANAQDELSSELDELRGTISSKDEEINNLKAELDDLKPKVAELTKINEDLKKSVIEGETKLNELSESLSEKEKTFNEQKAKLEKAETELSALKPAAPTEYTSEERLVCPSCGARGKDLKVEEDKSKVLGYVGHSPLYAKINVCKKCGYKF